MKKIYLYKNAANRLRGSNLLRRQTEKSINELKPGEMYYLNRFSSNCSEGASELLVSSFSWGQESVSYVIANPELPF